MHLFELLLWCELLRFYCHAFLGQTIPHVNANVVFRRPTTLQVSHDLTGDERTQGRPLKIKRISISAA